jgi:hypothetical protein
MAAPTASPSSSELPSQYDSAATATPGGSTLARLFHGSGSQSGLQTSSSSHGTRGQPQQAHHPSEEADAADGAMNGHVTADAATHENSSPTVNRQPVSDFKCFSCSSSTEAINHNTSGIAREARKHAT